MNSNNNKILVTLEMANNHMGDVQHALHMIDKFAKVCNKHQKNFNFAWKFQFRDIATFIHKDQKNNMKHKYIKRFTETQLSLDEIKTIKAYAKEKGFITMCTAFDEPSVDLLLDLNFEVIKVASCSANDWPLLNYIAAKFKYNKKNTLSSTFNNNIFIPNIIVSTAGVKLKEIDNIVSFFYHRNIKFGLMHCVGKYPTEQHELEMNQISLFKERYSKNIPIGFSTHERPNNFDSVKIAIAKGATILEKHVAIQTKKYDRNLYSSTPFEFECWLKSAEQAIAMCGVTGQRHTFSEKELFDLRQFKRGVFAKQTIKVNEIIDRSKVYYAWPNSSDQLVANDMSKYTKMELIADKDLQPDKPIFISNLKITDTREKIWDIVQNVKQFLQSSDVVFPMQADLEISHHYGLDNFYNTGITMITVINKKEYCKKLIIMLPGQAHPEQYHKKKDETFIVLYGTVMLELNGKITTLSKGDVATIEPGVRHKFSSKNGCIIEEISTTHFKDDSFYTDSAIHENKNRKTLITHWLD